MIELCGTKILIFGTKIHFRRCFDIKIPVMHSVPWWLSFAIWFCFSNDSYKDTRHAMEWCFSICFCWERSNKSWWYLDFWLLVVTDFYDFGNFCQNWSIGITPGLGMLTNHDANDAYLDKDNFIRTRKCENLFLGAKIKIGKVKISQKCQDVCPIMIFIIYFQDFKLPIRMT